MNVNATLGIVGAFVVVGGIVGLIMMKASKDVKASAVPIHQQNEVLKEVGTELGLAYSDTPDNYGGLKGTYKGVPITVRFSGAYQGSWIEIVVPARPEQLSDLKKKFPSAKVYKADDGTVVAPTDQKVKAGSTFHYVVLDADVLRRWIEDVAASVASP